MMRAFHVPETMDGGAVILPAPSHAAAVAAFRRIYTGVKPDQVREIASEPPAVLQGFRMARMEDVYSGREADSARQAELTLHTARERELNEAQGELCFSACRDAWRARR